jgi:hypothetical protein
VREKERERKRKAERHEDIKTDIQKESRISEDKNCGKRAKTE